MRYFRLKILVWLAAVVTTLSFHPWGGSIEHTFSLCLRRLRLNAGLTHPIRRLSVEEANEVCLRNMHIIRDNMPAFSEAARRALAIYQAEGLDAFEQKGMVLLQDAMAPVSQAVMTIKNLSHYIAFTQGSYIRQLTENFLRGIAQELGADKIIIQFIEGWGFTLNHIYSLGLSEQEYENYVRNRADIHQYLILRDTPEEERAHYSDKQEAEWLKNGPRLLQESGISSAVQYYGYLSTQKDEQDKYRDYGVWVQNLLVGRAEEGVREKGAYTQKDIQRIKQAIMHRLDTYREIKQKLFDEWHNYLVPQVYLRHSGGIDTFIMWYIDTIFGWYLPELIAKIRQEDKNSPQAREDLVETLEYIPYHNERILIELSSFMDMMETGLDYRLQDVVPFLQDRVASFQPQANIKGIELNIKITDGDAVINCDINQFALVIDSIVGNAIKYTQEGSVTFTVYKRHGNIKEGIESGGSYECEYLEIIIEDTGIGIPEDELNRVSHRGYRASNVGDIQGTGIGLDIVFRFVESMNGIIKIESELGKGTRVILRIPLGKMEYHR